MNVAQRGSAQDQSIVIRCTKEDKMMMKSEAAKRGTNISALVKELLIKEKMIEPSYLGIK